MIEHRVYGEVKDFSMDELYSIFSKLDYIKFALLFGSRVDGTFTRKSDYDFAIIGEEHDFKFGLRAEAWTDISQNMKIDMNDIDIVDLKKADKFLLDNIKKNYIIIKGNKDEMAGLFK
jgi:predicted nucleotidyltransferase